MSEHTQDSILELGIPEISMDLKVNSITTQPTDKNLENDGQPADAKAVGDRFAEVDDDIADLGADLGTLSGSVDTRFAAVNGKTGADIPVNSNLDALKIDAAIAQVQTNLNNKNGTNIPVTGETGAATIAAAIQSAAGRTGSVIPINDVSGALTIEAALNAKNGANIPVNGNAGAATIENAISNALGVANAAVKTVDGQAPGQTGNVTLGTVYPQRKVISVYISAGASSSIVTNEWITADTDCYAHTLASQNVPTGVSWVFEAGKVTFTLDEALSDPLTFQFGMIKGGVSA